MKNLINKIICGDCLEVMKQIPDKSIDLVLTDPPYGIGIDGQKESYNPNNKKSARKKHDFMDWDKAIPTKEYFDEIKRVSKNQIIFGANYFNEYLEQGHKGWIIWDKGQHGLTMSDCEIIYSSFNKPTRVYVYNRAELIRDVSQHPTQKPIKLMEKIIADNSKEGELILDCFAGSGSTLKACQRLNRNFIGVEREEKYCEIARQRLRQQTLI